MGTKKLINCKFIWHHFYAFLKTRKSGTDLSSTTFLKKLQKSGAGFTLLEILLVVGIIATLAGIVIQAINPSKQLGDTRNAKRSSDVRAILDAVYQYSIDNQGSLPTGITSTATEICTVSPSASCGSLIDLSPLTSNEKYLVSIPIDPACPSACATYGAGYQIKKSLNNRVTVSAPDTENIAIISVTK